MFKERMVVPEVPAKTQGNCGKMLWYLIQIARMNRDDLGDEDIAEFNYHLIRDCVTHVGNECDSRIPEREIHVFSKVADCKKKEQRVSKGMKRKRGDDTKLQIMIIRR